MIRSPEMTAARHYARLLGRAAAAKLGLGLAIGASVVFGYRLLSGGGAESLASGLCWITWGAAITAFALFGKDASELVATSRLMTLRGLSTRSQTIGREASQLALIYAAFAVPGVLLCLCLSLRAASLAQAAQGGLILLGLLAAGGITSLFLSGLSWLSRQLTTDRPGSVLFALLVVPDLLHEAIPELPSLFATSSWMFTLAISPGVV